jgi:predicted small lipoprotein YifL
MSGAGRRLIGAAGMLALLSGCGQTGPLYMPGDEEAAQKYDRGDEYDDRRPEDAVVESNADVSASPNEQDDED